MNQNNFFQNRLNKKLFIASCVLLFLLSFAFIIHKDWTLIFTKDLYAHDESVNSVVAANVTRKIFPAMVRVNPLVEKTGIWMEGPYWQHIPPLFAYIPLPFFKADGHVTIEVKRLAYSLVMLLAGIIFITTVALFENTALATIAAALSSILFIFTKFSRHLITGLDFGASDIVLAFTVICSFAAMCWYLNYPQEKRHNYPIWKFFVIGLIVAFPILSKNVLGTIPASTFFILALIDQKKINLKILAGLISLIAILTIYFVPLYISSPATFRQEIFVSFAHTKDFEGWARPWHIFITDYIPRDYTRYLTPLYTASILTGLYLLLKGKFSDNNKPILTLSITWFIWNLLAVSVIKSKAPNFIFQTYLLSIFFSIYVPLLLFSKTQLSLGLKAAFEKLYKNEPSFAHRVLLMTFVILLGLSIFAYGNLLTKISKTRAATYAYNSEHKKFYHFAEVQQSNGANEKDIFFLNSSTDDCWFRYYILFLTGAESRGFDEILFYNPSPLLLQSKYDKMYLVVKNTGNVSTLSIPHAIQTINNFQVYIFDTKSLNYDYLKTLESWLSTNHKKIYQSNQNCQWISL